MNITLNGKAFECRNDATIQSLVEQQKLVGKRIAIEVNLEVIPRSQYGNCLLQETAFICSMAVA